MKEIKVNDELAAAIKDERILILPEDISTGGKPAEISALFWQTHCNKYKKLYADLMRDYEKVEAKYNSADRERTKACLKLAVAEEIIDDFGLRNNYNTLLKEQK